MLFLVNSPSKVIRSENVFIRVGPQLPKLSTGDNIGEGTPSCPACRLLWSGVRGCFGCRGRVCGWHPGGLVPTPHFLDHLGKQGGTQVNTGRAPLLNL